MILSRWSFVSRKYAGAVSLAALLLSVLLVLWPAQAQTTILQDEFNGSELNNSLWEWRDGSKFLHRTRFGNDATIQSEGTQSFLRLPISTYHPDATYRGNALFGTEINSRQEISLGSGVEFEFRLRGTNIPSGIVFAFYTYSSRGDYPNQVQDEIDIEYLGKQPTDRLWLNIWNDWNTRYGHNDGVHNLTTNPAVSGLNRNNWNTYKVRWLNNQVDWLVNDVRVRRETVVLPDDPMQVRFNIWAPDSGWSTAYDSAISPTSNQSSNRNYYFDVDYIRVRSIPAASGVVGNGEGLTARYYDDIAFTDWKLSRIDPRINFNWGSFSPHPSMANDSFTVRWSGQVQAQFSENYTFHTRTDDGVRLWVNGQLLIDQWKDQGATEYSGTIALTAGQKYDIRMDYYDRSGGALAELKWSSASTSKQFVPQTQLYAEVVANPTFSPNGGTFNSPQTVTIATTTSSAVIRYTRDGSDPTTSSPQIASGATLTVSANTTLKARAWKDGSITSGISTATFVISNETERTPPTVTISAPGPSYSYRTLTTARGSASDTGGSGVQQVRVRLYQYATNSYWNGTTWVAAETEVSAAGTSSWTYTLPTLSDGKYSLRASATDVAGNIGTSSTVDFFIDNLPPSAVISSPIPNYAYRGLSSARGGASDGVWTAGVHSVQLQLFQQATNTYWNGSSWSTSAASEFPAQGTSAWTAALPALTDGNYTMRVKARDYVGNVSAWSAPTPFLIDVAVPSVAVSTPAANATVSSLSAIEGIATNNAGGSGMARVDLQLLRRSDNKWWTGSDWGAATNLPAVISGNSWSLRSGLPAGTNLTDGMYNLYAYGYDRAANSGRAIITFTVKSAVAAPDRTPPIVGINTPAANSTVTSLPSISGTAIDNHGGSGVARVELLILRRSDNKWWTGSAWGASTNLPAVVSGNNWSRSSGLPAGANLPDSMYNLYVYAYDKAGNSGRLIITFTVKNAVVVPPDTTPPTVTFSNPAPNAIVTSLSSIGGIATDNSGGSGVARVELLILRRSDNKWWTGSDWGASTTMPTDFAGTTWSRTGGLPSAANLTPGLYNLYAYVYDNNRNVGRSIITVTVR